MAGLFVLFDFVAHFDTVHFGHHDIGDDAIGQFLDGHFQTFFPVFRFKNLIFGRQDLVDVIFYLLIVFNDEKFGFTLVLARVCRKSLGRRLDGRYRGLYKGG